MNSKTQDDLAILAALEAGPLHGYAVHTALHAWRPEHYRTNSPLYAKLHALQHAGHLSAHEEISQGKARVIYALTEKGTGHLSTLRGQLNTHLQQFASLRLPGGLNGTLV